VKCGFCGYDFDPAQVQTACKGCPLAKECHLVRCPRCGYEMPPEAKLVRWVRRLLQRTQPGLGPTPSQVDDPMHAEEGE
jgi:hypothetical protein